MSVLRLINVVKTFTTPEGERHRVIDVPQFELGDGEQAVLAGGSGSGKTTLLNLIAGILRPDQGEIHIASVNIAAMTEPQRDRVRAANIGYVFQTFNLLQGYTALENVELGMAFGRGIDRDRAAALLRRVGMADRLHYRPRQLSVGQQQRIAVARALANSPKLVLADEPTGNLDTAMATDALKLIREVCAESGAALLLVSHDPRVLNQFDRVEELSQLNRAALEEEPQRPPDAQGARR